VTKTGRRVVESKASAFYFTSPVAVRNARSHTRARTHMHVYTHTHACTHTRTRTRMYTHTHTHAHTSTRTDAHRHVLFSVRGATDDIAPLQGGPTGWARTWYDISTGVPASQRSLLLGGEMSMWTDTCAPAMHQDNTRHATCNTRHATCDMQHATFISVFSHLSPVSAFISAVIRQRGSAVIRRYCYTMQCGAYTGPTPVGAPLFPPERRRNPPESLPAACSALHACIMSRAAPHSSGARRRVWFVDRRHDLAARLRRRRSVLVRRSHCSLHVARCML
jgi:hypothetical protein